MTPAPAKRLPWPIKVCWGFGNLAPATIISITGLEIMIYFTDHVGLAPALAGAILAAAKAYDAGSDFLIGLMSDRFNTRWGRRRPWLIAGSIMLSVSVVLMFNVDTLPREHQVGAAIAFVLLFYTGYSSFQIPYGAMAAEMSRDYHERTSLQAIALTFAVIASLLGTAAAPALIVAFGSGVSAFHTMAWSMAAVPLIAGAVAFFGTAKAPRLDASKSVKLSIGPWFTTLLQNKPLLILLVTKLFHLLGAANATTAMIYLATYVLDVGQKGMVVFGLSGGAGGLCGMLLVSRLAAGRSKHKLYAAALLAFAAGLMALAFLPRGDLVAFGATAFWLGVVSFSALALAKSMVADIVDYDYRRFGVQRAGAVTSLISMIEKTMPVLSALIVGIMLSWGGYVAGKGAAMQPAGAINAIYLTVTIIPSILLVIASLPLFFFYRLDEAALDATESVHAET